MSGAADWSVSSKKEENVLNIDCKLISTILFAIIIHEQISSSDKCAVRLGHPV